MLAVQLPKKSEEILTFLAKQAGKSTTEYTEDAFFAFLEEMEDIYTAEKALKRFESDEEEVFDLKDVDL